MKRFFLSMLTAVMAIAFVGCEYDDSELTGRVENLEGRVQTLEQLCQQMNTNITAMQAIINALQTQDAITAVTPITEGGKVIGYTITFVKGDPITIYHGQDGKDGADGADGADGKDGYTPTIGVAQDEDGEYYWTLDGEWLTDKDGNKIPTSGKDGTDGEDGTTEKGGMPELKIQGGYWYVSYDGGETWERLGRATGYDGSDGKDGANGDAFFEKVDHTSSQDFVIFTLSANKGEFYVPKYKEFSVELGTPSASYVEVGEDKDDVTINYTVKGCDNPTVLVISDLDAKASNGVITVKAPADKNGLDDVETVTLMVSNGSTTVMASVDITVADAVISGGTDTQTNFENALSEGKTSIVLPAGTYSLPAAIKNKTVTIVGNEDVVVKVNPYASQNTSGATIIFDGVTIEGQASGNYEGFQHTTEVTFKNCKINNQVTLYSKASFENCTFNSSAEHCVWTYGSAEVTFTDCDFTYSDRCVNVYVDNGTGSVDVSFTNCNFITSNASSKGAVEINSSAFPQGATISFTGCTKPAYGEMVFISGWDNTNGATATVTIDGKTATVPQLAK